MAHDLQIVRAKENLKLSYGGPNQRQASSTNQRIKALRHGRHWAWGLTHRLAIKEKTIHSYKPSLGLQPDKQKSHDIHVVFTILFIFYVLSLSKECRTWSDAAICDIWSGSALFTDCQ